MVCLICLVHFFETHIIKLANPKDENNHRLKAVGTVGFSRGQITQAEESEAVVSQRENSWWIASEIWRFYETWDGDRKNKYVQQTGIQCMTYYIYHIIILYTAGFCPTVWEK